MYGSRTMVSARLSTGDVVSFASYVPLLARRNHTQWHPDLIYFSGTEVFPTANYYVQQLFGQNGGDTYLESQVSRSNEPMKLAVSAVRDSRSGDLIVKIVNGGDAAVSFQVHLAGVKEREYEIVKTTLTGPEADAVDEDGRPPLVKPELAQFTIQPRFTCEALANSLMFFRVQKPLAQ